MYGVGGWSDLRFDTVTAATLFNLANYGVICLEGGNGATTELMAFYTANLTLIQNWVNAGGRLFVNFSSNEGPSPATLASEAFRVLEVRLVEALLSCLVIRFLMAPYTCNRTFYRILVQS